jgi:two-component system response regulator PilR (NtrC family)
VREGYDVDSAGSVEEAWRRLRSSATAAIITDMRLPDGTGLDLLRRWTTTAVPRRPSSSPPTARPRTPSRR